MKKISIQKYDNLKACLQHEVMNSEKKFSWLKVLHKAFKCTDRRFNFWWRVANYLFSTGGAFGKSVAEKINRGLRAKYGADLMLGSDIGPGLRIEHYVGVVITDACVIGKNFRLRQNTTIGVASIGQLGKLYIGDDVFVGANCCIIGDDVNVGDNVTIGAMTFVNKSVPSNSVIYTVKNNEMKIKDNPAI